MIAKAMDSPNIEVWYGFPLAPFGKGGLRLVAVVLRAYRLHNLELGYLLDSGTPNI